MRTLPFELECIRDDLNSRFARWDASMQRRKDQAGSAAVLVLLLIAKAASIGIVSAW